MLEQNILEQAAGLLSVQDLNLVAPYLPCHDLIISILIAPNLTWMIPFFQKLATCNEDNQIYSLTITGPEDQPNRMYSMSPECFASIT